MQSRPSVPLSLFLLFLCLLAPPALAETDPGQPVILMPEVEPTEMGRLSLTADGQTRHLTTFDYSVGAPDASAQFRTHYDCKEDGSCEASPDIDLVLRANVDGDPQGGSGHVILTARFGKMPKSGAKTRDLVLEAYAPDRDDPTAISQGRGVLKLTSVSRGGENGDLYGHASGSFKIRLCAVDFDECHDLKGSFDTAVQFDIME